MFRKKLNRVAGAILVLALVLPGKHLFAQSADSFASLQQPSFAKYGGLGGVNVSNYGGGQPFYIYNPAVLSASDVNNLMVSYGFLPGGAGLANVNYAYEFDNTGVFGASMQYLSYGEIQGYDLTGSPTNVFTPSDYTFQLTHARQANNFRIGVSAKFSNTAIDGFNGNALLFDIGGVFVHPTKSLTIGAAIKNFGWVTSEFSPTSRTTLPFDVQLGMTFKPEHMPVQFSITLHQLHEWNLMLEGEEINSFNTAMDNIFRHLVIGTEFILNENFSVLAGYNHLRRKELQPDAGGSFSGFALGLDLNINAFEFVYALGGYHTAGNNHNISLSANLSEIRSK